MSKGLPDSSFQTDNSQPPRSLPPTSPAHILLPRALHVVPHEQRVHAIVISCTAIARFSSLAGTHWWSPCTASKLSKGKYNNIKEIQHNSCCHAYIGHQWHVVTSLVNLINGLCSYFSTPLLYLLTRNLTSVQFIKY